MNNVQFITWKPIYWIQHLALSPLHLFFNTSAKKKEIKAEFNSQSHFWIVFCQGNPCCKHIFLSKKIVITTTFTYLQLKARFVLEPVSSASWSLCHIVAYIAVSRTYPRAYLLGSYQSDIHPAVTTWNDQQKQPWQQLFKNITDIKNTQ